MLPYFVIAVLLHRAIGQRACYVGPGLEYRAPSYIVPCVEDGETACCRLGDTCLSGNACYNYETGNTYQYGCTDSSYQDPSCPYKCGWNATLSPWTNIGYCAAAQDTWVCYSPESCGCDWPGQLDPLLIADPRSCGEMGSDARVALYAPSSLAPYVSLPSVYGGSTGYYSTTRINGTETWAPTTVAGYTPSKIQPLTAYEAVGPIPKLLFAGSTPAPTTHGSVEPYASYVLTADTASRAYWSKPTTTTSPNSTTSGASPAFGVSLGAKLGIVFGVIGSICILGVILFIRYRHRNKRRSDTQARAKTPGCKRTKRKGPFNSAHTGVPVLMISAVLLGLAFALGHHFFYMSLAGSEVPGHGWPAHNSRLSLQQVNIATGSALAFLVRACLVVAASTAYYQVFWRAAKTKTIERRLTVEQIDAAYSVLGDILAFKTVLFWLRRPGLLFIAVFAWLLPIVPIVTPATLTVQMMPVEPIPSRNVTVPSLDFRSLAFSATIAGTSMSNGSVLYAYNGPSLAVQQIVGATALQGSILPIQAPALNSTWKVDVVGPALQCRNLTTSDKELIEDNIAQHVYAQDNCFSPPVYLSWFQPEGALPFPSNFSTTVDVEPKMYIALLPSLTRPSTKAPWNPAACEYISQLPNVGNWTSPIIPTGVDDTVMMECELIENVYEMYFHYKNGQQRITTTGRQPTQRTLSVTSNFSSIASIGPEALDQLSYQSLLYAFKSWISGTIQSGLSRQQPLIVNSSVLTTVLLNAPEMAFLRPQAVDGTMGSIYHTNLQEVLGNASNTIFRQSALADETSSRRSLASTIEELFLNMTISLMSSEKLLPDSSLKTGPAYAVVKFDTYQNTYVYSATKLWITYGLAIGLTTIVVFMGFISLYKSGASYDNSFSTIMRTSRGAELSVDASEESTQGAKPLPKALAKATIRFHDRDTRYPEYEAVPPAVPELDKPGVAVHSALLGDDQSSQLTSAEESAKVRQPSAGDLGSGDSTNTNDH